VSRILVAFGLLVLLAAAVLAWSIHDPSFGATGDERLPTAAVIAEAATRDTGVDERLAREPASAAELGAESMAPQRVTLVVTWPDDRPAAGAEVRYWPARSAEERDRDYALFESLEDLEAVLTATGLLARTDVHGAVTIDVDPGSDLCARSGDYYAALDLADSHDFPLTQYALELARDLTLRVLVTDAAGRPREGIEVHVDCVFESRRLGAGEVSFAEVHTDANGLARVAHLQRVLPMPGQDTVAWSLTVGCGDDAVDRLVSWAELTAKEPLRFVLPIAGAVAARIVDGVGGHWRGYAQLIEVGTGMMLSLDSYDEKQGVYWFRRVPLDRRWQLRCVLPDHGSDLGLAEKPIVTTEFLGPQEAEAVVTVPMQVPECRWWISGRIVRSDGLPMPDAIVTLLAAAFREREGLRGDRFDFRCNLPQAVTTISDLEIEVRDAMLRGPLVVRVDRQLEPGHTVLEPVVVPVPAVETLLATVEVRCAGRAVTESSRLVLTGPSRTPVFTVRRDEGSRSRLYGAPHAGELELLCTHPGCRAAAVTMRAGSECTVELAPTAELLLRIRPPAIPYQLVACDLLAAGEPDETTMEPSGQFHWTNLTPGTCALRIRAMGRVLWELPSFELVAGANVWPPDGAWIDLRSSVRAVNLDVRPADGQGRIEDFATFFVPTDQVEPPSDFGAFRMPMKNWLVPSARQRDVLVHADGFVPVRVANPTVDTVVQMQRLTTLQCVGADPTASCTVRVVGSPLRDPMLLALRRECGEPQSEFEGQEFEVSHPPGTVLELTVVRGGKVRPPQHVVVGSSSPQRVVLE
jgi:hypothetical protein